MLHLRTAILGCAAAVAFASVTQADLIKVDYTGASVTSLWNTVAGGDGTNANKTGNEGVSNAIDGDLTTKYLNFGYGNTGNTTTNTTIGTGTGLYVTLRSSAVVTAIQFATANDNPDRDPLTITVEGSNATGSALMTGTNWTLLYSGVSGLLNYGNGTTQREVYGDTVTFTNTTAYTSYRILVTSKRGSQNSVQYSEVVLFSVPEPSTMLLGITGTAGLLLLTLRRRRMFAREPHDHKVSGVYGG